MHEYTVHLHDVHLHWCSVGLQQRSGQPTQLPDAARRPSAELRIDEPQTNAVGCSAAIVRVLWPTECHRLLGTVARIVLFGTAAADEDVDWLFDERFEAEGKSGVHVE